MSDQTTQRRFFSSSSLERAVLEAAGHYGLEPDQLAYTKLEKRGVASRGKVSIKVDPAAPAVGPDAAAPKPAEAEIVSQDDPAVDAVVEPVVDPAVEGKGEAAEISEPKESAPGDAPAEEPAAELVEEPAEAPAEEPAEEHAEAPAPPEESPPEESLPEEAQPEEPPAEAPAEQEEAAPQVLSDTMSDLPRTSAEARRSWSQATGPLEQAARKWTESLLRVASLDLDVEIYERDGELEVHLGGADVEVAVEDGGEVLRSIQHLLPRLMLGTVGESVHCKVDCNDFRELHEERLRAQALGAAAEAVAERGEVTLDPMHPADRRIVHLALADNELVRTESLGRGFFKRVSIRGN